MIYYNRYFRPITEGETAQATHTACPLYAKGKIIDKFRSFC
jgi:hypothetical protein